MMKFILSFVLAFALASAAFAEPASLRADVEAHGSAITLGDLFENADAQSGRAVALAPAPGRSLELSARLVATAAAAAGLEWTAPEGLTAIHVTRSALPAAPGSRSAAQTSVRRSETITLSYQAPGLQLVTRARALEDGSVGESIRAINLSSNREIDAVVTGSGAATVTAMR